MQSSTVGDPTQQNPRKDRLHYILISLYLGILLSFVEAFEYILFHEFRSTTHLVILKSLAGKICLIFMVSVVLLLLIQMLGRLARLDRRILNFAPATFLVVVHFMVMEHRDISFGSFPGDLRMLIIICGGFLGSLATGFISYRIGKYLSSTAKIPVVLALIIILPFLLAEIIFCIWVKRTISVNWLAEPSFLTSSLFINGLFLVTVLLTVIFFLATRRTRWPIRILTLFISLVLVVSGVVIYRDINLPGKIPSASLKDQPIKHVILITVDTLRFDVLSCYQQLQQTPTENMDRLAEDGILFQQAYASAPWTIPSVSSILTGQAPNVHLVTEATANIPAVLPTWAEYMHQDGYVTHAIGNNVGLCRESFAAGFDNYDFYPGQDDRSPCGIILNKLFPHYFRIDPSTTDLTDITMDWLDANAEQDFFLWLHYFDPHDPYAPPQDFLPGLKPAPGVGISCTLHPIRTGHQNLTAIERHWVFELYKAETRYIDDAIGRLIEHLKRLNIYDDALIILTSDHGEEFWEHDGVSHSHTLYNELLRVPMIFKLPQSASKGTVNQPISNISIMPTVLDLCDVDYDRDHLIHESLMPLWTTNSDGVVMDAVYSTGVSLFEDRESLIYEDMKYIRWKVTGREELYDLINDPEEMLNMAVTDELQLEDFRNLLTIYRDESDAIRKFYGITESQSQELSPETRKQLKALGYIKDH